MIPDVYPPLRQWLEQLKQEVAVQKDILSNMENRLALCEALTEKILKEKEESHAVDH